MLKKCVILGLTVLLVGGLALGWLYNETRNEREQAADVKVKYALRPEEYLDKYGRWHLLSPEEQNRLVLELDKDRKTKTREQLAEEQQLRLRTDLDKLAAGEMNPGDIADFLYGQGWEEQVEQYKKRKEQKEIARTTSIVCISIGGAIMGSCLVFLFLRLLVRLGQGLRRRRPRPSGRTETQPAITELTDIHAEASIEDTDRTEAEPGKRKSLRGRSLVSSDPDASKLVRQDREGESSCLRTSGDRTPAGCRYPAAQADTDESPVAVLLSDEKLPEKKWSPDMEWSAESKPEDLSESVPERRRFTPRPRVAILGQENAFPDGGDTLQEQADDLQRQLAEFKQMAQSVQQATREQSEPLGSTLKELAQQVSAIREYAASQQGRVEKLQDGYDWNIIRTFCLRVIRCIDNIENRIDGLGSKNGAAADLEEVRDELLFALESSGVEQFRPEINSEYRGQEKLAEAIKEKQSSKNSNRAGKIAKVIRPGYRYMIDEENFKIVRTAQVKLFG